MGTVDIPHSYRMLTTTRQELCSSLESRAVTALLYCQLWLQYGNPGILHVSPAHTLFRQPNFWKSTVDKASFSFPPPPFAPAIVPLRRRPWLRGIAAAGRA